MHLLCRARVSGAQSEEAYEELEAYFYAEHGWRVNELIDHINAFGASELTVHKLSYTPSQEWIADDLEECSIGGSVLDLTAAAEELGVDDLLEGAVGGLYLMHLVNWDHI